MGGMFDLKTFPHFLALFLALFLVIGHLHHDVADGFSEFFSKFLWGGFCILYRVVQ